MSDFGDRALQVTDSKHIIGLVKTISEELGEDQPFYIADLADVVNKYLTWKRMLPDIQPYYAVKCNDDPVVLQLLASLGVRFDCASKGEIESALNAGAKPSEIIFAHSYKYRDALRYAAGKGVRTMTFDSEDELKKIKAIFPEARVVLRLRIENEAASFPLNRKFGCDFNESINLLDTVKKLDMDLIGLSFHVGSMCSDPVAYSRAITLARKVFTIAQDMGFNIQILDLGGGFPGSSGSFELFRQMCECITQSLDEHFPAGCGVRLMAEPGCYFVCSAFTLCTTIVGKRYLKENFDQENTPLRMYYINDGVYGSFAVGFEDYGVQMKPLLNQNELRHRALLRSKLWGCTCCSMDCVFQTCLLPDMKVGEQLIFENAGAYTISLASTFNGFSKPGVKYIFSSPCKSKFQEIRTCEPVSYDVVQRQLKSKAEKRDSVCGEFPNLFEGSTSHVASVLRS